MIMFILKNNFIHFVKKDLFEGTYRSIKRNNNGWFYFYIESNQKIRKEKLNILLNFLTISTKNSIIK